MDEEEVLFVVLMDGGAGVWVLVMVDEEVLGTLQGTRMYFGLVLSS